MMNKTDKIRVGVNGRPLDTDNPGGAIKVSEKVVNELIARSSVSVTLYGPASLRNKYDCRVNSQYAWNWLPLGGQLLFERFLIPRVADADDMDVLLYLNGNGPPVPTKIPIMMYVHDVSGLIGLTSWVHTVYCWFTLPLAARYADQIITVSEFSRDELKRFLRIPESQIEVIRNGLDDVFLNINTENRKQTSEEYILYVGGLNPRKNVDKLISAFLNIKDTYNEIKLYICGQPNKFIYKKFDLSDHESIKWLGYVSQTELVTLYKNATVCAYPSNYEGFGLPPLEAIASGTAVLTSDIRPFTDILENSAQMVDPGSVDAIQQGLELLLNSEEYRNRLITNGKSQVQQFTWSRAVDQLVCLISQQLND